MKESTPQKSGHLIRSETGRKNALLHTNTILLIALVLFIFILPVIPGKEYYLTRILLCVVVAAGLFAADFTRTAFRILFSIGSIVIVVTLLNLVFPDFRNLTALAFILNITFFILVTIALVAHVARARKVYGSTILCAVNSYLLMGLTLSILFLILEFFIPESFSQLDSGDGSSSFIYFGFVTLTTLGYGDITPDTPLARSLASFTALLGQLYLVIIMALIIGKYLSSVKSPE